jgi:DNA-binding CsgD family transcriptional regulator/GAF domain-containing protein
VLSELWNSVSDTLVAEAGDDVRRLELVTLMRQIKVVDEKILNEQIRHRESVFQNLREGLASLSSVNSPAKLIEQAAAAVCQIGFDRSILSRIDDSSWVPEKVHVERDAKWADEILAVGRAQPQPLDGSVVETDMVRRRKGIVVDNVQTQTKVHKEIAEVSLSRSYVAAPVMIQGDVVGFIHADCYYQRRDLNETDLRILKVFAEGVGQALDRTLLLDRIEAIQAEANQVVEALSAARYSTKWATAGGQQSITAASASRIQPPLGYVTASSGLGTEILTRRETDVLRLMAAGDTNTRIANRLLISEGTVKSHVAHILHKLGAANRAEAVSQWFRQEHARQ